jgi:competence protein ComEC
MNKHLKYGLWAILIMASLIYYYATGLSDGRLHFYALDVGQGDALLIRTPDDEFVLVDGGPDDSVLNELAEVMPFYRRDLALVFLTHPHPDHVNGLVEVVRRYDVERVLMTGIDYDYAGYRAFLEAVAERGVGVDFADGEDFKMGGSDSGGVTLDMVFPATSIQGRSFTNVNNSSIVFRLIYGETVFFFEGDCELECEEKIVAEAEMGGATLSADVLKVGHHGSRTSSGEALLDAVFAGATSPQYAVIQVGTDNRFKHPHPETVIKLQERGVRILRTDIDGRVEFMSDGKRVFTPS